MGIVGSTNIYGRLEYALQFSCETESKNSIFENLGTWNDNNKMHVKGNVNVNWIKLAEEKL